MHLVHIHAGKIQTCIKTNKALKQTNKNPHIVLGFFVDMRGGGEILLSRYIRKKFQIPKKEAITPISVWTR